MRANYLVCISLAAFPALSLACAPPSGIVSQVRNLSHGGLYQPLSAQQFVDVRAAAQALFVNDLAAARSRAALAEYEVEELDTGERLWLLRPGQAAPAGQASLWVRPNFMRNLLIEAPHVPYDRHTDVEAALLFAALGARGLVIAGADRCVSSQGSGCLPPGLPCGFPEPRQSDVAHAVDNAFFAVHEASVSLSDGVRVLQLHANRNAAVNGDVMVTNGTREPIDPQGFVQRFIDALRAPNDVDVRTCNNPLAPAPPHALCGTVNVEAHSSHGAVHACLELLVTPAGDNFVHVEQNAEHIAAVQAWSERLAVALSAAF